MISHIKSLVWSHTLLSQYQMHNLTTISRNFAHNVNRFALQANSRSHNVSVSIFSHLIIYKFSLWTHLNERALHESCACFSCWPHTAEFQTDDVTQTIVSEGKALKRSTHKSFSPLRGPVGTESSTDTAASCASVCNDTDAELLQHRHLGRKHFRSSSLSPGSHDPQVNMSYGQSFANTHWPFEWDQISLTSKHRWHGTLCHAHISAIWISGTWIWLRHCKTD